MASEVLAVIPARGGSKGIPRKNIIMVGGKPLIAWSIQQAMDSTRITRVVVSTDDGEIASVAREYGAEVPFIRPAEYADDVAPDIDVFRHTLSFLADQDSYCPDLVVHLRPTGPARRVSDIDAAIDLLDRHPWSDSVRAVSLARQSPYKMWELQEDGTMEPVLRLQGMTDCQSQPRQLLPPVYWQNGYVDVLRPRAVFEKNSMWGDTVLPFVVKMELFDLDYPEDIGPMEEALTRLEYSRGAALESPERHPV